MGNTVSKCSREDDGDETGGLEMFLAEEMMLSPFSMRHIQHGLDTCRADDPRSWKARFRQMMELLEQSEEEETETMKEDVTMFLRALTDAARYGRMSGRDGHMLMEWAIQRGWVITGEMELFLMDLRRSYEHGGIRDVRMCRMHLRHLAYDGDERLLDRIYRREVAEIIHHLMQSMGLGSLAAEVRRFLIDEACTPPATKCWEYTSDPTNEFCESFQRSLVF